MRDRVLLRGLRRGDGAGVVASLPAAGESYIGEAQRQELQYFFQRFGCHHCGSRFGRVVGDHMPPNKFAHADPSRLVKGLRRVKPLRPVLRALNLHGIRQRFYPQCGGCSQRQAAADEHATLKARLDASKEEMQMRERQHEDDVRKLKEEVAQVEEQIAITVLHEIGHYLGLDEDELELRGLG